MSCCRAPRDSVIAFRNPTPPVGELEVLVAFHEFSGIGDAGRAAVPISRS
jgi:hypothetical protein